MLPPPIEKGSRVLENSGISRRAAATFIILLILCSLAVYLLVERKYQFEYIKMERVILNQSNRLTNVLTRLLYKTQALSALVVQHNGKVENFEKVAATLLDDPAILNVLAAPGGVVRAVYPVEGNEAVLGLNFFEKGAGNQEAVEARDTGRLVLGGPFTLVQGGEALVGRLPVYADDGKGEKLFWGLVSVTLKFPQALNGAELDKLSELGLAYEIWRVSPETNEKQVIAHSAYEYNDDAPYIEVPLTIFNAHWFFRVSPIKLWYQYPESWLYISLGVLVSFLLAMLAQHNLDLRRVRSQLENMAYHDPLTGILNRRGLFERLPVLIGEGGYFSLYYLDLNNFKTFNDTYGHTVGDRILQVFTERVRKRMDFPHLFARIGGDEFILIAYGQENEEKADKLFNGIRVALQDLVVEGAGDVRISFSMGKAVYPRDGNNIDELIAHADGDIYTEKRTRSGKIGATA